MRCPNRVVTLRHGETPYNAQRQLKQTPEYRAFKEAFNDSRQDRQLVKALARPLLAQAGVRLLNAPDVPLTENGQMQAQVTARALKDKVPLPGVILVSPYERAVETLERMKLGWPELADVPHIVTEDLREQEVGRSAEYYDWRLFLAMHPEEHERRDQEGPYAYRYPEGENVPDVCRRTGSVLHSLATRYPGQDALLITHHVPVLAIRVELENLTPEEFRELDQNQRPINCGVTMHERCYAPDGTEGLVLSTYNERLY